MEFTGVLTEDWTEFKGPRSLLLINSSRKPKAVYSRCGSDRRKSPKQILPPFSQGEVFVDAVVFYLRSPGKSVTWHPVSKATA